MAAVRVGVLVSGSGTILESLLSSLEVTVVASDRACRGLEVARAAGVEALLVDRALFGGFGAGFERDAFSAAMARELVQRDVDLVVMAGFGTVLGAVFHDAFAGRVLNTHPSLLPEFPGWHAVAAALAARVTETGCTVHLATVALDDGPVLARRRVSVRVDDDEASLHERIKRVERELYPTVVARVMAALAEGREPVTAAEREED
ncbi:MAG: phosphoribosylglycinamide formyltransferase [Acidimicrobiales bacterium]